MKTLKIGLLGLGNVGGGVYSLLKRKHKLVQARSGVELQLLKIADRGKSFPLAVEKRLLTRNVRSVLCDPEIDTIVELFGHIHPTLEYILEAFKHGKDVVTANKALLAEHGEQIFEAAARYGRRIFFEASAAGGVPVIQALRNGLVANEIGSIHSIINGTCNYILTEMTDRSVGFQEALRDAQKKGFAEANPKLDVEGIDAAHKLTVLASLAFGKNLRFRDVYTEGITQIRPEDIAFANEFGYCIKLLAIAKKTPAGIEARVQPTLILKSHQLANVSGSFNAVLLHCDETGDLLFYGRGAGARPTASAVVSDLAELAHARDSFDFRSLNYPKGHLKMKNLSLISSRYYFRFNIVDRPGILAQIARILGSHKISISDVIQKERRAGSVVPLILLTHHANEGAVRKAVHAIDRLSVIRGKTQVLRIEV